jgi:hypothetical protein
LRLGLTPRKECPKPLELRHMLFPIRFGCVNRMARREPSWAPYFTNQTTAIFPSLTC